MALSVIGAGFGRTGTLSLTSAPEQLGVGRCDHVVEVFEFLRNTPEPQPPLEVQARESS